MVLVQLSPGTRGNRRRFRPRSWLPRILSRRFISGVVLGGAAALLTWWCHSAWVSGDNPLRRKIWLITNRTAFEHRMLSDGVELHSQDPRVRTVRGNDFQIDLATGVYPYNTTMTAGLYRAEGKKVLVFEQASITKIWKDYQFAKAIRDAEPALAENGAPYGGLKKIFMYKGRLFALASLKRKNAIPTSECIFLSVLNLSEHREVFRAPCLPDLPNMNLAASGGGYAEKDGNLLLALGAPSAAGHEIASLAQDATSPYGKVLFFTERDLIGRRAPISSFTIYSSGHRNIEGMSNVGGAIFAVENGPKGGDELNLIQQGKNYGWPIYSLGSTYSGEPYAAAGEPGTFEDPLYAWIPSVAPSDVISCPRSLIQRYAPLKCLLVSSLRGQAIFVVLLDRTLNRTISVERLDVGMRVREFSRGAGGEIYISTDEHGVFELRISHMVAVQTAAH